MEKVLKKLENLSDDPEIEEVIFEVFVCANPASEDSCYRPIYDSDIFKYCNKHWIELTEKERNDVICLFNH